MSGEAEKVPEDLQEQPTPEQVTAAFAAGFADDDDGQAPAPQEVEDAATASPSPTPAPAPEFVQITKTDWDAVQQRLSKVDRIDEIEGTVRKRFDNVFGDMGGLRDKLAQIQQATPQGGAVELSDEDFAEMKAEYPEIADLSRKVLNKALGRLKGTGGQTADPKAFDEKAAEIRSAVTQEVIDSTLDAIVDGDWREAVNAPGYDEWIGKQAEDVKKLGASSKLRDAAKLMRLYRKHLDTPAPTLAPPAATPSPAPAQPSMRSRQMAAAVAPKGEAATPATTRGKSAFELGFESED